MTLRCEFDQFENDSSKRYYDR